MRSINNACSGALTSDMKKPPTAIATSGTPQCAGTATPHIAAIWQRNATAVSASGSTRRTIRSATSAPDERAAAERAEEPAEDVRVGVVLRHDEHGQRREEERPADVEQRERRRPDPQQPVAEQEPHAGEHAALVRPARAPRADARTTRSEHERDEVGRGVDVEDVRRADRRRSGRRRAAARGRSSAGSRPGTTRSRARRRRAPRRRAPGRPRAARRSTAR